MATKKKEVLINTKCAPELRDAVKQVAFNNNKSVSKYMRELLMEQPEIIKELGKRK